MTPRPTPFRRRMKRRLRRVVKRLALCMILPVALLLLHFLWGWQAAHRLANVENQLRAQGIRFEHPPTHTPDADNPAIEFERAMELTSISSAEDELLWGNGTIPEDQIVWTDAQRKTIRDIILARHQPAFELLDAGAAKKGPVPSYTGHVEDIRLGGARLLAKILIVHAQFQLDDGNQPAALHDLLRINSIAHYTDHRGSVIHNLYAIAIRSMLAQSIERFEPRLTLSTPEAQRQAQTLLRDLQDPDCIDSAARNFEAEIGCLPVFIGDAHILEQRWASPLQDSGLAQVLDENRKLIPFFHATSWPLAKALMVGMPGTGPAPDTNLDKVVHWGDDWVGYVFRVMLLHFRGRTDILAAQLLLASRLYAAQHGSLPKSIADLVPDLLAAPPLDPFSPASDPLHFRLDPKGPTIWSVGENGADDGAPVLFHSSGTRLRRYGGYQPDMVYGAAWRTATPPSTAPVSPATLPIPLTAPSTTPQ